MNPSFTMYTNKKYYKANFYLKRKLPVMAIHNVTKIIGTKSFNNKMNQLKDAILKCE